MDPRSRGLIVNFIRTLTYLTIDDIYSGTADYAFTRLRILKKVQKAVTEEIAEIEGRR